MARPRKAELPPGITARTRVGGVTYYVSFQTAAGVQKIEKAGGDLRAAKALLLQRRREVREATYVDAAPGARRPTLAAFTERWAESMKGRKRRAWETERNRLRDHVLPRMGPMLLADIQPTDVAKLVLDLKREATISPKTIQCVHGALSSVFSYVFCQLITTNPAANLPGGTLPTRRPTRDVNPWTIEEAARLIFDRAFPEDRRVIYAIAAFTGARLGEVAGMRWRDIDTEAPDLWLWRLTTQYDSEPLKTSGDEDKPRDIPIHPTLRLILETWRQRGAPMLLCRPTTDDDFVVPREDGRCHSKNSMGSKDLHRRAAVVGFDTTARDFHSFRRFFLTWSRTDGARVDVLERITHNAAGAMVDRYTFFGWAITCQVVQALRWPELLAQYASQYVVNEAPGFEAESGGGAETRTRGRPSQTYRLRANRGSLAEWVAESMREKQAESATNGERITHVLCVEARRVLAGESEGRALAELVLATFAGETKAE
jgi:integrase